MEFNSSTWLTGRPGRYDSYQASLYKAFIATGKATLPQAKQAVAMTAFSKRFLKAKEPVEWETVTFHPEEIWLLKNSFEWFIKNLSTITGRQFRERRGKHSYSEHNERPALSTDGDEWDDYAYTADDF